MTRKDYESELKEYRKTLLSEERFLNSQEESWRCVERFLGSHFRRSPFFLLLFIFGFLFALTFIPSLDGNALWLRILGVISYILIPFSSYIVHRFRLSLGSVIYHSHMQNAITQNAYLEKICEDERIICDKLCSLTRTIHLYKKNLRESDPSDTEKIKSITTSLDEFTEDLFVLTNSLEAVRSVRDEYSHSDCFDFQIQNIVIERHKPSSWLYD